MDRESAFGWGSNRIGTTSTTCVLFIRSSFLRCRQHKFTIYYYLPHLSFADKLVEPMGVEPTISGLQNQCLANLATTPIKNQTSRRGKERIVFFLYRNSRFEGVNFLFSYIDLVGNCEGNNQTYNKPFPITGDRDNQMLWL